MSMMSDQAKRERRARTLAKRASLRARRVSSAAPRSRPATQAATHTRVPARPGSSGTGQPGATEASV